MDRKKAQKGDAVNVAALIASSVEQRPTKTVLAQKGKTEQTKLHSLFTNKKLFDNLK